MPVSLLTPFFLIFPGIIAGMLLRALLEKRGRHDLVPALRQILQRILLAGVNPITFALALWVLDVSDPLIFLRLPLIGLAALVIGYGWGLLGSKLMRLPPLQAGVWRSSASFTNIGNIGGVVVFAIIGESGFALVPFYKFLEELWYYSVVFPLARKDGERHHGGQPGRHPLAFAKDPFFLMVILSMVVGLALHGSGLARPAFLTQVNGVLIPLSTFGLLISIGLSLHITRIGPHLRKAFLLTLVKFGLTPVLVCGLALAMGITPVATPFIFATVLILSAMPTGFLSLVPPSLYKLDLDLANACWLVSNAALVVVVPILWLLVRAILG